MKKSVILIAAIIIVIVICSGVFLLFFNKGSQNKQNILLTNDELKSLGLKFSVDENELLTKFPSRGMIYSDTEGIIYSIGLVNPLPNDNLNSFIVHIDSYSFNNLSNRDELYRRDYDEYQNPDKRWDVQIEENTYGEKSYLMKRIDNYVLVFEKKNFIIRIEAETGIGVDKVKAIGKIIENKIN
jgi:hypothetical protein